MGKRKQAAIKLTVWHRGGFKDKAGNLYTEGQAAQMLREGKATLTQWKNSKRPTEVKKGRPSGSKSLKRVEGGYQNQYGVIFTEEQRKALSRAVDRSNYKRGKQLAYEDALVSSSGRLRGDFRKMGGDSDFIIARQSKNLQQFKSMADFEAYMDKQTRIQSGEYLDDRTRLYKRNHMKALENVFGDDAKDVIMKIRMMKPEVYREKLLNDEFLEVNYIYDPSAMIGKLNQIRRSLGMREKEIYMDEE